MPNEGAMFLGLARGMQKGMERQQEMGQRKDLLKLEQDKLKLVEKELELKGTSTLYDALYKKELAATESMNPNRRPKQPEGFKLSPGEQYFPPTAEPGVFGDPFTAPMTPQQRGVSGGAGRPSSDIQMVDRLVSAGVPERQALDAVLGRDREGLLRLLLATSIRTPQLPGMPGPDVQGIMQQYDQMISGKSDPLDELFKGLPPLPGSVQEELQ